MKHHWNTVDAIFIAAAGNIAVWNLEKVAVSVQILLGVVSVIWVLFQLFRSIEDRAEKRRFAELLKTDKEHVE